MREAAVHQERRCDGDDDDGGIDDQTINSKSTFHPPQSRRGTITYSACVLGVRLRYRRHGEHVVTELKWAKSIKYGDTRYIGALGPCSLFLIFSSDLVKIYLVDPYRWIDVSEFYLLV